MNKLLTGLSVAALLVGGTIATAGQALAWHYNVSGKAACVENQLKVTWTVDNSSEGQPLHIVQSNRNAVPAPFNVPAHQKATFSEVITHDAELVLKGNWDGDKTFRTENAHVKYTRCVQPTPSPSPSVSPTPSPSESPSPTPTPSSTPSPTPTPTPTPQVTPMTLPDTGGHGTL